MTNSHLASISKKGGGDLNIFYLDCDIKKCAQYHCDKHVAKMILEYAQKSSLHYLGWAISGQLDLATRSLRCTQ